MDSTSGERHRHRQFFLTGRHIGEQQQLCAAGDQRDCLCAEAIDRGGQCLCSRENALENGGGQIGGQRMAALAKRLYLS